MVPAAGGSGVLPHASRVLRIDPEGVKIAMSFSRDGLEVMATVERNEERGCDGVDAIFIGRVHANL